MESSKSEAAGVCASDGPTDAEFSVARLAAIVESSDDAIISKTLEGKIVSWNAGAERIFGYPEADVLGKSITIIIPAERLAEEQLILQKIRRGDRVEHFETIRVTRDGRPISVSLTISPVRDARGRIVGASKIARDITARKRDARLRAQLAAIVESSDDAIVSKSLDGKIQSWNAAATRMFGYSAEEAIGQSITLIIPDELRTEEKKIIDEVTQGRRVHHFDTVRVTKSGQRVPVSLTVSPIRGPDGAVIGASKIARDITERQRVQETLRTTQAALQEASRRKDEFIALLAHELRNPLAPIRYALAVARRSDATTELRQRSQEIIERQVNQMSRLLDDLLNVARITHGTLEVRPKLIEVSVVLDMAVESAQPYLEAKHHTLSLDLTTPSPYVNADPARLAQVFSNLLINAAKYTDPGGLIRISTAIEADDVVVVISDNGIGISPEVMPRLFEMFTQASSARERSEGGLGLGLALVQGIVKLHGGSVQARSSGSNRGSEFQVRLPLAKHAARSNESPFPRLEQTHFASG